MVTAVFKLSEVGVASLATKVLLECTIKKKITVTLLMYLSQFNHFFVLSPSFIYIYF